MGRLVMRLFVVLAVLGMLALAFYGGAWYQNRQDQSLFTAYNPAQASGGAGRSTGFTGGGGFGGGTGTTALVGAALSVGDPPPAATGTTGGAAAPAPTAVARGAPAQTPGPSTAPNGQGGSGPGATTASGAQTLLAGHLVSLTNDMLTVKTIDGKTQSLPAGTTTLFYQASSVAQSALAVGQRVSVAGTRNAQGQFAASSVTIAPSGSTLFASVRSLADLAAIPAAGARGGGTGGGFGGAGGSGGGFGGGGGGFGGAGGRALTGTIGSITNGAISVQTVQGFSLSATMSSATKVYSVVAATKGQLKAGSIVTAREATANGHSTATAVVDSTLPDMAALLSAPRTRTAGATGQGGTQGGQGGTQGGGQSGFGQGGSSGGFGQ